MSEQVLRGRATDPHIVEPQHPVVLEHDEHGDDHGVLHHHFEDMVQQREATSLGMWTFLSTEVMMFGGLFFVYTLYRWVATVKAHQLGFFDPFYVGSQLLNHTMGLINTFVLLASSFTMAMGVYYAQMRNRKLLVWMLTLTWLFGLAFLVIKGFEWMADYNEGLVPALNWNPVHTLEHGHHHFDPNRIILSHLQMYFVIYFCMTGLHAIHMVIGLGIVGYFIWMANKGMFTNGNDQPVELVGMYWHFVDIVWVFLFPLLYLIAGHHV